MKINISNQVLVWVGNMIKFEWSLQEWLKLLYWILGNSCMLIVGENISLIVILFVVLDEDSSTFRC